MTASKTGYYPETYYVVITNSGFTTQDFHLAPVGSCGVDGIIGNASTGLPVSWALVKAYEYYTGAYKGYDYTDQYGYYKINLAPGIYKFKVSRSGFITKNYCCKSVYKSGFTTLNLLLTPEGGWYPD